MYAFHTMLEGNFLNWVSYFEGTPLLAVSVTRLGDLLHFGQPFKAFGNNN